jgi:2-methylisocitrate lyase-like PEP mutase family enzyme
MLTQSEKANLFKSLHIKGDPLVLYNIWDAGSAKIVASAGARAVATGSASVAMAYGFTDGEKIPLHIVLENLRYIVASTELPVSLDFEGAYGVAPEAVAVTCAQAISAGAIGFNFEDQIIGGEGLYAVEDQCARIEAMRSCGDSAGVDVFINARTDIFLKAQPADHNSQNLDAALERAHAYAQAGASGFFAPGLDDEILIARLCENCPLPVNFMMTPQAATIARLGELGVSRISFGPGPYRAAMQALKMAAEEIYDNTRTNPLPHFL